MNKKTRSLEKKIDDARKLFEGIYNHLPNLDSKGLNSDYMLRLEEARLNVENTMAARDRLESEKRTVIRRLREQTRNLDTIYAWGRAIVKCRLPQTTWLEFGIYDQPEIHP